MFNFVLIMAHLGLQNYHKKDSTDDLLDLLFSSNEPKESTVNNFTNNIGSFYIGDNSTNNSESFDESHNESDAFSNAPCEQGLRLQVQPSNDECPSVSNSFPVSNAQKVSSNTMPLHTDNKSMFPFSFYTPDHFQEALVKLPRCGSAAFLSSFCCESHPNSDSSKQSLIETINHSLSSIPRNSSLANALNDFEKTYEQVKRRNEENDRLHDCKIPKMEISDSASYTRSGEAVYIPSVSSFCALLAESNSHDVTPFNSELNSTSDELRLPYPTPSSNPPGTLSYLHVEQNRSLIASTCIKELEKSSNSTTTHTAMDNEIESLLDGVIPGENSNIHWNNASNVSVKCEATNSQSSSFTILQKFLAVSTECKVSQNVVKGVSSSGNSQDFTETICPACKKPASLNKFNDSSLQLCSNCIQDLQQSLKTEVSENKEKSFASSSSGENPTLLPKKENLQMPSDSNSNGVVAHLVAINSANNTTAMTSAVPLYIVMNNKAIPLTVAQVQPNMSASNVSSKPHPIKPNTSESAVTSSTPATSTQQKNSIKIAPLPVLSANSGSSLIIAGITPGTETESVEKTSPDKRTKSSNDDALRIHGCTYPNCNKRYFKSSHLKAHIRLVVRFHLI